VFNVKDIKIIVCYARPPKSFSGFLGALLAAAAFGGVAPKAGEYVFEKHLKPLFEVRATVVAAASRKASVGVPFDERWRAVTLAFGAEPRTHPVQDPWWLFFDEFSPSTRYGALHRGSESRDRQAPVVPTVSK
jgi:hypothetical protein